MAKVFSAREIQNNQFPLLDDFESAADAVVRVTDAPEYEGKELMIFGSVDERTHNIRSDLDCLIVYPSSVSYEGLFRLLSTLREVSAQFNVPIEPVVVSNENAKKGHHNVDAMFLDYLREIEFGVRVRTGSPATRLAPKPGSVIDHFYDYTVAKSEKFVKASLSDEIDYSAFQRALELPRALQRKYERLVSLSGASTTEDLDVALAQVERKERGDYHLVSLALHALETYDTNYIDALQQAIEDPQDANKIAEYADWVEYLYPKTLRSAVILSVGASALVQNVAI